jgi:3-deoxy-7-phosphoheptulonate synthase
MIVMSAHATPEQLQAVLTRIEILGLLAEVNLGTGRTVLGVSGHGTEAELEALSLLDGVERVVRVLSDYPLASREFHPEDRIVSLPGGIQIGARNMQNYRLLEACALVDKPVLLKRGMSSTLEEWLHAAEYILAGGNLQVALCERGIRTFEPMVRFTLDITSVPVLKRVSSLPVVVDPSHAAGRYEYVSAIGLAAVAAGADGLLVEVHPNPKDALSDGPQSLSPKAFANMMTAARKVAEAVGRVVT